MVKWSILGIKGTLWGGIITFWWQMITLGSLQCSALQCTEGNALWTKPPKKSGHMWDPPPPLLAMPGFGEFLVLQPKPNRFSYRRWAGGKTTKSLKRHINCDKMPKSQKYKILSFFGGTPPLSMALGPTEWQSCNSHARFVLFDKAYRSPIMEVF